MDELERRIAKQEKILRTEINSLMSLLETASEDLEEGELTFQDCKSVARVAQQLAYEATRLETLLSLD